MKALIAILISLLSVAALAEESSQMVTLTNGIQLYCSDQNKISLVREAFEDMKVQIKVAGPLIESQNSTKGPWAFGKDLATDVKVNDNSNVIKIRIFIDSSANVTIDGAIASGLISKRERKITIVGSDCVISQ